MNREEILQKANDRGWYTTMHSADGSWHVLMHAYYPFALELWPDTEEFLFRYNTGLFTFQSGKCGSFTLEEHFNRIFRQMRRYVSDIRMTEDNILEENSRKAI